MGKRKSTKNALYNLNALDEKQLDVIIKDFLDSHSVSEDYVHKLEKFKTLLSCFLEYNHLVFVQWGQEENDTLFIDVLTYIWNVEAENRLDFKDLLEICTMDIDSEIDAKAKDDFPLMIRFTVKGADQ